MGKIHSKKFREKIKNLYLNEHWSRGDILDKYNIRRDLLTDWIYKWKKEQFSSEKQTQKHEINCNSINQEKNTNPFGDSPFLSFYINSLFEITDEKIIERFKNKENRYSALDDLSYWIEVRKLLEEKFKLELDSFKKDEEDQVFRQIQKYEEAKEFVRSRPELQAKFNSCVWNSDNPLDFEIVEDPELKSE